MVDASLLVEGRDRLGADDLAAGDQEELIGALTRGDDDLAGLELLLREPISQGFQ